jgi:catalase
MNSERKLTTASGIAVSDNQNSLSAGPRGPLLLQDFHLIEKLQHFNRERIPERVVHAKGSGAYGQFVVTKDIQKYTKAKIFDAIGKMTDIFVRFSTVGGEKGSADTERDPRGFAVRFYTEEGNWDLVGNNTPMFFIKDPIKFPDFVHTQKRCPKSNLKSPEMMFDFWSKAPESLHQVTMLFSNRGTPDGYRHMDGFGSHTFSLINSEGSLYYVKWHLKTQQGIKNLSAARATDLAGTDPDYAQRDLFEAIGRGDFPKWKLMLQVATEKELVEWESRTGWNPFDLTKVWPHADFPRVEVGIIELNKNPDNYHSHVEQVGFSPANVVPGMGYSPDKMLQGRLFAYHDAQLYRLGANHQQLSVNSPRCPVHNQQRDGLMALNNGADDLNYDPVISMQDYNTNSEPVEEGISLSGKIGRFDARNHEDNYTQAGNLFRLLSTSEKIDLYNNLARPLSQVSLSTLKRQLYHFDHADISYGKGVREALKKINPNISMPE